MAQWMQWNFALYAQMVRCSTDSSDEQLVSYYFNVFQWKLADDEDLEFQMTRRTSTFTRTAEEESYVSTWRFRLWNLFADIVIIVLILLLILYFILLVDWYSWCKDLTEIPEEKKIKENEREKWCSGVLSL